MAVVDTKPGMAMPAHLVKYWSNGGEGGAKIRWNSRDGGDFLRCVKEIQAAVVKDGGTPLPDKMLKGMCNELHRLNADGPPGHGSNERPTH